MVRWFVPFLSFALLASAEKRPITHEDVWLMKRVSGLAASPDGKWAVVSVTEPSYDDAKTATDLWMVPVEGGAGGRGGGAPPAAGGGAGVCVGCYRVAVRS